jgi:arabinan endo-1,5-alpha-L-arabinosidase
LVHWSEGSTVFPGGSAPEWVEGVVPGFWGHYWAPDVVLYDGVYRLYYSVSRFGKQTSAIGLATSSALALNSPDSVSADRDASEARDASEDRSAWEDQGVVIQSREGDPYNAIDPSVLVAKDGRHWLAFGSFWDGIYLMELNPQTGRRLDPPVEPTRIASAKEIEAATLLQHGDWHYLFVNHGLCCRGVESTYRVVVGRSREVEGPYLDKGGVALTEGGGTPFLASEGAQIGPGHIAPLNNSERDRFAFHYYDRNDRGKSKLALARWRWSSDGWPEVADVCLAGPDAGDSNLP